MREASRRQEGFCVKESCPSCGRSDSLVLMGHTGGHEFVCVDCGWPNLESPDRQCSDVIQTVVNQTAKRDEGKPRLSLVPPQIIRDIAQVREYGNRKYGDPDNWKTVEMGRYVDALMRHLLAFLEDQDGVDSESGIQHYKHMACNMAFICAMMESGD